MKKIFYKLLKIRHWRKGKCKQCGQCCRTITFRFPDKLLTRESEFEYLKKQMSRFEYFFISDRDDQGVLLFTCKFLNEENKCSIYHFRSIFCRFYPHFSDKFIKIGGKPLEGCGFYYEPVIKFEEYIKDKSKQ